MRVLYASHTSVISGAERTLLDLLRGLPDDIEPVVACPSGELRQALDDLGVPCIAITGTSGSLRLHPWHSTRALVETVRSAAQLRAAAAKSHPDLIHANSIRASLIASVTRALGGPPTVAHLHDVLPVGRTGTSIARLLATSARVVLANSQYTASDFERKAAGRGHVEIVDNPVDLERFDPSRIDRAAARARLSLPTTTPLIGVVAQITPWKGQSDAIRALAIARRHHPELKLVLAGAAKFIDPGARYDNVAYAQSLLELAKELNVEDAVIYTGEIDEIPELMAALDLVLLPSWEEPFGRVVIEAMAMGAPVLATNVGGPADIVSDGIDGVLLAPRCPDVWGSRVSELLDRPERTSGLGEAARATADRYDLPSFTHSVVKSYESALTNRALPLTVSMGLPHLLRLSGRWLMRGPRRRRLYEALNTIGRRFLGTRIRSGPGAGLHFRGGDTIGYLLGLSEPALQAALSAHLRSGDVLYDVGAHAGFVSVIGCRIVGPLGHVHCFEPVPSNVATLRSNLEANGFRNATVHELALSDEDGEIRMDRGDRGITAHAASNGDFVATGARCDSLDLSPPTMIKIDVEGAESRVLQGMRQMLSEAQPVILVEVHAGQDAPVRDIFAELGYDVMALDDTGGMPHLLAVPSAAT
jgi:FkbM family methyltransferase